jgi:light-regulated signal transduction histidine kinase (bacteriophytochrome)
VHEALNLVEGRIKDGGIEVEVSSNLPKVNVDRARLVEVVQNLVDNAAKFVKDQPDPKIEIGVHNKGEERIFYVKDNGIGIDPKYNEKIFGLFDKLNPDSDGTGVGLSLVKRIVEVHGGRIWVESEAGKGATFCFTLADKSQLEVSK